MPDENTTAEIGASSDGLWILPAGLTVEMMALAIRSLETSDVVAVVVPEPDLAGTVRVAGGMIAPPTEGRILARCTPMTDAIKRIEGRRVVENVDRDGLRLVDWPMVVPIGLVTRWAAMVLDASAGADPASPVADRRRRPTAAALLSQFVRIEPGLRVVGIDDLS